MNDIQVRIVWTDGKSHEWKTLPCDPARMAAYLEGYMSLVSPLLDHYEIRLVEKEATT